MALPLLIPIAIGVAGLFGVGKTVKAAVDNSDANDIAKRAQRIVDDAQDKFERARKRTQNCLESYGNKKLDVYHTQLSDFLELLNKFRNLNEVLDDLKMQGLNLSLSEINGMKKSCETASSIMAGIGAGVGTGALLAFGAYGGVMALGAAGTGTAISALSGVAATNATLAWIGGGTLAAGGLGVTGGLCVLGTMVAGPALLVFGSIMGSKASEKLSNAKSNLEKARTYEKEVDIQCQKLKMIDSVVQLLSDVLSELRGRLRRKIDELQLAAEICDYDFKKFSKEEQMLFIEASQYAKVINEICNHQLLNDKGELVSSMSSLQASFGKYLEQ